jgi:hypothetical protein
VRSSHPASPGGEGADAGELAARLPLVADLEPATRAELLVSLDRRRLPAGALLFEQGTAADGLYFLSSGEVALESSGELITLSGEEPQLLGLPSLVERTARTASVRAYTPIDVAFLPAARFWEMLGRSPSLGTAVLAHLVSDVRRFHDDQRRLRRAFDGYFVSPNAMLSPGPYEAEPFEQHAFVVEVEHTALQALLPEGIRPSANAALVVFASYPRFRAIDQPAERDMSFREASLLVPCRLHDGRLALWVVESYADGYAPIVLGREIFGLPRRFARTRDGGGKRLDLDVGAGPLLRASWRDQRPLDGDWLRDVRGRFGDAFAPLGALLFGEGAPVRVSLVARRQVPSAGLEQPDALAVDDVVEVPLTVRGASDVARLEGADTLFFRPWLVAGRCILGSRARIDMRWGAPRVLADLRLGALAVAERLDEAPRSVAANRMSEADELRSRAWRAVGVDDETAARFAREHRSLRPSSGGDFQRAIEVLDTPERARLMRNIAALYGRIHHAAPSRFVWAGFASIAVNDGVAPAVELTMSIARVTRSAARLSSALGWMLGPADRAVEDGIKCAFETNYAIFADLGWVHLAFLEGGIEVLRRLHRTGTLDARVLDGFEDIDRGARLGGEVGDEHVIRGNLALFHHEQDVSVTPVFTRYAAAMAFATRLGLVGVPNRKLAERAASLGRRPEWAESAFARESYGPFTARWRWLVAHAWEPLITLESERRERRSRRLEAEVGRAVRGRRESLRPPSATQSIARLWSQAGGSALASMRRLWGRRSRSG